MALACIKCHIIEGLRLLSSGESEWERCWSGTAREDFPVTTLHREAVEHKLVELYVATTEAFVQG